MAGGAMRQAGIFAAAGLYTLDHHVERLAEDHADARLIADRLTESGRVVLDAASVRTNILVFGLADHGPDAPTVVACARERGVLVFAFGTRVVRAVTHFDVSHADCRRAASRLLEVIDRNT